MLGRPPLDRPRQYLLHPAPVFEGKHSIDLKAAGVSTPQLQKKRKGNVMPSGLSGGMCASPQVARGNRGK